jgi:hypothetical protein
MLVVSERITRMMNRLGPVAHFLTAPTYARHNGRAARLFPDLADGE